MKEKYHITIRLQNQEDFQHLVHFIRSSGYSMPNTYPSDWTVECYLDDFVLSIVKTYLTAGIVYHNPLIISPGAPVIAGGWEHKPTG